jgi:hypothetical protein
MLERNQHIMMNWGSRTHDAAGELFQTLDLDDDFAAYLLGAIDMPSQPRTIDDMIGYAKALSSYSVTLSATTYEDLDNIMEARCGRWDAAVRTTIAALAMSYLTLAGRALEIAYFDEAGR